MSDENEEQGGKRFKVVDRRRFDMDGEARPDAAPREEPPKKAPAPPPPAAQKAAPSAPAAKPAPAAAPPPASEPPPEEEESPIPFAAFLQSMAQQALMQLGMIPFPSGTRQLDLEGARDTVDILAMLRAKTRGNLTAEEDKMFEQVLYELRMTFLEVARKVAAMGGGPAGGPLG